ncbi:MAG TPA: NAD(P)/FAD-dependent oxidoreductase [Bacteroidia bacterium]|nr:NAD(P)/FAD-dependent oxidoreductase [Bacteroidia bacterium]
MSEVKQGKTVVVIGGGAAGFFSAITCAGMNPHLKVILLEKTSKVLSKVRISGGGRCNVTHACYEPRELVNYYPRGGRELLGPFHTFSPKETIDWFSSRGVELKVEADGRIFPVANDSSVVVSCLINEAYETGVDVRLNSSVGTLKKRSADQFDIVLHDGNNLIADRVILTPGGFPTLKSFEWFADLGHTIIPPVPSLFTFNMPDNPITELMGVSVENARVKIQGMKISNSGSLLITHWGMSGPCILKLSSLAARDLQQLNYQFKINVSWLPDISEEEMRSKLQNLRLAMARKKMSSSNPFHLPKRLWEHLLFRSVEEKDLEWAHLRKEELNKLVNALVNDEYSVSGKTTFKEEFVTCGGVDLREVDFKNMESKKNPGLFFAGEVLNIDAVTGGFNFQAAWTTAYLAGKYLAESLD